MLASDYTHNPCEAPGLDCPSALSIWLKLSLGDSGQCHLQSCAGRHEGLNPQFTEDLSIDFQKFDKAIYSFLPQCTLKFFVHQSLLEFFPSLLQLFGAGPEKFPL